MLISVRVAQGQASGSDVAIITTYSQNQKYYLKSVPYDNEFPTLRGTTFSFSVPTMTTSYSHFRKGLKSY